MLDVASNLVTLVKPSSLITIGVDQGLYVEVEIPAHYRCVRHPTLPLLFEYNCRRLAHLPSNHGKFVVTSEAGYEEEAKLGARSSVLGNGIFNKYCEAKFVSSTKKRVHDIADCEEQERLATEG